MCVVLCFVGRQTRRADFVNLGAKNQPLLTRSSLQKLFNFFGCSGLSECSKPLTILAKMMTKTAFHSRASTMSVHALNGSRCCCSYRPGICNLYGEPTEAGCKPAEIDVYIYIYIKKTNRNQIKQ